MMELSVQNCLASVPVKTSGSHSPFLPCTPSLPARLRFSAHQTPSIPLPPSFHCTCWVKTNQLKPNSLFTCTCPGAECACESAHRADLSHWKFKSSDLTSLKLGTTMLPVFSISSFKNNAFPLSVLPSGLPHAFSCSILSPWPGLTVHRENHGFFTCSPSNLQLTAVCSHSLCHLSWCNITFPWGRWRIRCDVSLLTYASLMPWISPPPASSKALLW